MSHKKIYFLFLIGVLLLCSSCEKAPQKEEKTVFAMDTIMTLSAYGQSADTALCRAEEEILFLDALWRRDAAASDVYAINENGVCSVHDDTAKVISRALQISASTKGAFDITVSPLIDLWGFYTKNFHVPSAEERIRLLSSVDYKKIAVAGNIVSAKDGVKIDLGGIAKGYLSDKIMDIFRESGVTSGLVSLGGNVQALGTKPDGSLWTVAVQSPDSDDFIGLLAVQDMAVITSGSYQRFFEENRHRYHHIIDPATGAPAESGLLSVTVVCPDGTLADGLSTALFVMGLTEASEYYRAHQDFEAIFMTTDKNLYITEGLVSRFESEHAFTVIKK